MDMEVAEEQVDETAAEEDDVKEGAADEVAADLAEQAVGTAKQMATSDEHVAELVGSTEGVVDTAEAEEVADQQMRTFLSFQALPSAFMFAIIGLV